MCIQKGVHPGPPDGLSHFLGKWLQAPGARAHLIPGGHCFTLKLGTGYTGLWFFPSFWSLKFPKKKKCQLFNKFSRLINCMLYNGNSLYSHILTQFINQNL